MKYEAAITIPRDEADEMQDILDGEADNEANDEVVKTYTATFPNGYQADIKVVDGDPPFVDPVLFNEHGQEVCCIEVADDLCGTYQFSVDGDTYVVVVRKALFCETNDPKLASEIRGAFVDWAKGKWTPHENIDETCRLVQDLQVDFEHNQWFVTHKPTGTQWSVHDAEINGWDTFDFEQVSEGEE